MSSTQSCYGTGNPGRHLPMLLSAEAPTSSPAIADGEEDISDRNWRLFRRRDVQFFNCGGPCASNDVLEQAFGGKVAL